MGFLIDGVGLGVPLSKLSRGSYISSLNEFYQVSTLPGVRG